MKLLVLIILSQVINANSSIKNFNFTDGEYTLLKGDLPCTDGYVGWMTGEESLSFMLGFNIVISNINEGKITSKNRTIKDCKFESTSKNGKNKLESIENTFCIDSSIKKTQIITISSDNHLHYTLKIFNDDKLVRDVKCEYEKLKESK